MEIREMFPDESDPSESFAELVARKKLDAMTPLLEAWDEMDNAAQRVLTALPGQMTEAAARLDAARLAMRTVIQRTALTAAQ